MSFSNEISWNLCQESVICTDLSRAGFASPAYKIQNFCRRLEPREKLHICKEYWNPQKMGKATHIFEIIGRSEIQQGTGASFKF